MSEGGGEDVVSEDWSTAVSTSPLSAYVLLSALRSILEQEYFTDILTFTHYERFLAFLIKPLSWTISDPQRWVYESMSRESNEALDHTWDEIREFGFVEIQREQWFAFLCRSPRSLEKFADAPPVLHEEEASI